MNRWANMSTYEGMGEDERNIYEIARYVRMPGDRIEPFVKVLAMCGYEIVKKADQSSAASHSSEETK